MTLSDAACFAWWWTAWRRGDVGLDDVIDALEGIHHVTGLPGHEGPLALVFAFPALRDLGAVSAGLALPSDGDPLGLGGPADFNTAAIDTGEAVILTGSGLGLIPHRAGHGVMWQCLPAARRQLPDLGEADRALRHTIATVAHRLDGRQLGHELPEVADAFLNLMHREIPLAPAGTPWLCVDLASRALQAWAIADLAPIDELSPLEAAARRALVAACSPEAWPPAP